MDTKAIQKGKKKMTIDTFNTSIWQYYLQLENDFYATLNFVEFSDDNFSVFSKEYSKQLLSICSEIDIVFKQICELVDSSKERKNITDYANILTSYEGLTSAKVRFLLNQNEFVPFDNWTQNNSPSWWKDYNLVKHSRLDDDNYKKGNLKNVFTSLAALYILNRYLCRIVSQHKRWLKEPTIKSKLFEMVGWESCIPIGNGFVQVLHSNGGISVDFDG